LRRADAELLAAGGSETDMVWRGSYFAYLWRYFRAMPIESCRSAGEPPSGESVIEPTLRRAA